MPDWEIVRLRGQEFVVCECGNCGVIYVVPKIVHQDHFDNGGFAHCSNGHGWGWKEGNTEREAVRLERDRLKQKVAQLEDDKRAAWTAANAQADRAVAAEKELKRTQTRIGAGVCPCCNRTFAKLARHMQSQHPDVPFVPAAKPARGRAAR